MRQGGPSTQIRGRIVRHLRKFNDSSITGFRYLCQASNAIVPECRSSQMKILEEQTPCQLQLPDANDTPFLGSEPKPVHPCGGRCRFRFADHVKSQVFGVRTWKPFLVFVRATYRQHRNQLCRDRSLPTPLKPNVYEGASFHEKPLAMVNSISLFEDNV